MTGGICRLGLILWKTIVTDSALLLYCSSKWVSLCALQAPPVPIQSRACPCSWRPPCLGPFLCHSALSWLRVSPLQITGARTSGSSFHTFPPHPGYLVSSIAYRSCLRNCFAVTKAAAVIVSNLQNQKSLFRVAPDPEADRGLFLLGVSVSENQTRLCPLCCHSPRHSLVLPSSCTSLCFSALHSTRR